MFKRFRVSYWILTGFIKKHKGLLIVGVTIGVLGTFLLPKLLELAPKITPTEKIAVIGRPTLSEIPLYIQTKISYGVTSISQTGKAIPAAAESFDEADDGKKFTFHLKDNLTWHDGQPFTAQDISYNFQDVQTNVIDDQTIEFILKDSYAPFPTIVSQPLFRQQKSKFMRQKNILLGIGEMKMTNMEKNGHIITRIDLKSPNSKLSYRFYPTQEAATLAFKLGEVDTILELSTPGELSTWPNTQVSEVDHQNRYVALFFNTSNPDLSSKGFRQALTYAISKKSNDQIRAISPINPNSWAFNPQVKRYDFNLEIAQKLIESEKEGRTDFHPKIELTTTLPHLETAENIKNQWSKLGVETNVKIVSFIPESFQVLLIAQEIPPDPDQYSLWHSTQPTNLTGYNSPKVDKLLEDGRQTIDAKKRVQIYHDFQRFIVEDTPAAFLFHHKTFIVKRS